MRARGEADMSATTVLIVDDQEENIAVLYTFLEEKTDYNLLIAADGDSALKIVRDRKPNLILLDIMMSEMNGIDVCRRIKNDPETEDIPIIFMTALSDTGSKLEGFDAGAVDYITKPFQQEEVLVRIQTHLTISKLRNNLQVKNEELKAFSRTVAHDLKNPLNSISLSVEIAMDECESKNLEGVLSELNHIRNTTFKANSIIDALLLLADTSRQTNMVMEAFDMKFVIPGIMQRMHSSIEEYGGKIFLPDRWPIASGFLPWVEEIWINYISNALKYGGKPPRVELGYDENKDHIRFWVKDNGNGLNDEQMKHLFVPFSRLHNDRIEGHGLGLSIVRRIVEKLGGTAGAECEIGQGCTFYFTLPRD